MTFTPADLEVFWRLMIAAFLGGILGFEREAHGKEAGFRTYAMVCLGASLIMIVSVQIFEMYHEQTVVDPSRIAAQVVTGIGFIGAGAIIRFPQKIVGLTTAAGIWTAAGIGLACGLGQYKPAILTTLAALIILTLFSKVDYLLRKRK